MEQGAYLRPNEQYPQIKNLQKDLRDMSCNPTFGTQETGKTTYQAPVEHLANGLAEIFQHQTASQQALLHSTNWLLNKKLKAQIIWHASSL